MPIAQEVSLTISGGQIVALPYNLSGAMSRPIRIEFLNALYCVTARGVVFLGEGQKARLYFTPMIDYDALAEELYDAGKVVRPVELLTTRYPELTWDDARAIARATDTRRAAAGEV